LNRAQIVEHFGKCVCEPPLSNARIKSAFEYARKLRPPKIRDVKIAERLSITPEENSRLKANYLIPRQGSPVKGQVSIREKRRREIAASYKAEVRKHPNKKPSCRVIARAVGAKFRTVARDLRAM